METIDRTRLATRIILRAIFPVMKVAVADDPKMRKRFQDLTARIQFRIGQDEDGAVLVFDRGQLDIEQGIAGTADISFSFKNYLQFNRFMTGKTVIPSIKGYGKPFLLIKVVRLLLAMKILMPAVKPGDEDKQRLKVKMVVYMITTALSQYNKAGDPDMKAWTRKQPDRVYQMSVTGEDIAAYVRVKAGKSKAGRGLYTRRRPFVHMKFNSVSSALAVFLNELPFVEAVGKEFVTIEGSPEYGSNLNDFMQRIQAMVV
jgi:hypothetical protein